MRAGQHTEYPWIDMIDFIKRNHLLNIPGVVHFVPSCSVFKTTGLLQAEAFRFVLLGFASEWIPLLVSCRSFRGGVSLPRVNKASAFLSAGKQFRCQAELSERMECSRDAHTYVFGTYKLIVQPIQSSCVSFRAVC